MAGIVITINIDTNDNYVDGKFKMGESINEVYDEKDENDNGDNDDDDETVW